MDFVSNWMLLKSSPCSDEMVTQSPTVDSWTAPSSSENLQVEKLSSVLSPVNRNKLTLISSLRGAFLLNTARTYNPKVKLSIWGSCHGEEGQFACRSGLDTDPGDVEMVAQRTLELELYNDGFQMQVRFYDGRSPWEHWSL